MAGMSSATKATRRGVNDSRKIAIYDTKGLLDTDDLGKQNKRFKLSQIKTHICKAMVEIWDSVYASSEGKMDVMFFVIANERQGPLDQMLLAILSKSLCTTESFSKRLILVITKVPNPDSWAELLGDVFKKTFLQIVGSLRVQSVEIIVSFVSFEISFDDLFLLFRKTRIQGVLRSSRPR